MTNFARGAVALLVLTLSLVLGACQKVQISRDVVPDKIYARVISLSPSTTELLGLVDGEAYLIGRTSQCTVPSSVREAAIVANPEPDWEAIANLQPDLIVADRAVFNPQWEAQAKKIGADVWVVDIHSLEDWKRTVYQFGTFFLRQTVADKRVREVEGLENGWRLDPLNPKPKALVVMGAQQPWAAGRNTFQADVVRACGAEPVGPDADKFVQVSPEQILAWNPDIIVVAGDASEFVGSPWDATAAGKRNRIIGVDPDVLLRAGGRVNILLEALGAEFRRVMRGEGSGS